MPHFFLRKSHIMIKINTPTNIGGMPTFEYTIHINGIAILLKREDFSELIEALDEKVFEDLQKATDIYDKYWDEKQAMRKLMKDLRQCFYDGDEDNMDAIFFQKDLDKLDSDQIQKVLNTNTKLLGFNSHRPSKTKIEKQEVERINQLEAALFDATNFLAHMHNSAIQIGGKGTMTTEGLEWVIEWQKLITSELLKKHIIRPETE